MGIYVNKKAAYISTAGKELLPGQSRSGFIMVLYWDWLWNYRIATSLLPIVKVALEDMT